MKKLRVGETASDFRLPGVDGKNHSLAEMLNGHKAVCIVFTCNHSPKCQAYEERLIRFQAEYGPQGVLFIAINPNDATAFPEDSLERMKVRAVKRKFNFPYLRDELQMIARIFGAECTPEVFLLDATRTLRYTGRIDDNWHDGDAVTKADLKKALEELLAGGTISTPSTSPNGCSVKWKF